VLLDSYDRFVDSARDKDEEETKKHDLFELLAKWLEERSCGGYAFATRLYRKEEQSELIMQLKACAVDARVRVGFMETDEKNLELLEEGDARALIRQARGQGATLSPFCRSDEKFILKQAGCHPYWLQILCHNLYKQYDQCCWTPLPRVPGVPGTVLRLMTLPAIWQCRREALERAREDLNTTFKCIWREHLGSDESSTLRETLIDIAREPGIKYRKQRKAFIHDVERLKREGLVQERKGGRVAITGKLFEAFVCEQEKHPSQRRWYEPCSPFRQRFPWLFSPLLRRTLLAVCVGLMAIFLWLTPNILAEILSPWVREFLQPVWQVAREVISKLPVWMWASVLVVILAIIGTIVLLKPAFEEKFECGRNETL